GHAERVQHHVALRVAVRDRTELLADCAEVDGHGTPPRRARKSPHLTPQVKRTYGDGRVESRRTKRRGDRRVERHRRGDGTHLRRRRCGCDARRTAGGSPPRSCGPARIERRPGGGGAGPYAERGRGGT